MATLICLGGAALLATAVSSAQESFEAVVIEPTGEAVPIEGLLEIAIDDIVIDYRPLESPRDDTRTNLNLSARRNWRLYGPGQAHWGNATFTSRGGSKELQAWFQEAAKGKNIRKDIQVTLKKSDESAGRGYNLFDCIPVQWSSEELDASSRVQTETLKVNIGRIELTTSTAPGNGGQGGGNGGILVTSEGVSELWDSWGNGEPQLILTGSVGSDQYHTATPGHKSVGEITLRGAMTDGRKNLCQWINDSVNGNPWKQALTVKEITKDGNSHQAIYLPRLLPDSLCVSADERNEHNR
jgi:hypothetical protein